MGMFQTTLVASPLHEVVHQEDGGWNECIWWGSFDYESFVMVYRVNKRTRNFCMTQRTWEWHSVASLFIEGSLCQWRFNKSVFVQFEELSIIIWMDDIWIAQP